MATNKDTIVDVRSVVEAISTDNADAALYQVESLCMRCGENGITRFLLTSIPHFRKILLSAFECPHCGERSLFFLPGLSVGTMKCSLLVSSSPEGVTTNWSFPQMLNRQVVKSETATIKIPELDFEIPPEAQRGSLSTELLPHPIIVTAVEGILVRAADELEALQEERKKVNPQTADAIDNFLLKLKGCAKGESSFTFILDDPAGNSFIENPFAPLPDPSLNIKFYERTPEQQALLGYLVDPSQVGELADEASLEVINSTADQTSIEPHGLIGAAAGHRAIAQGNSVEIAEALFRYSAPEEAWDCVVELNKLQIFHTSKK
ncbi:hypothetical protein U1Q18_006627 [Sarracenia purpurea var. burkii]